MTRLINKKPEDMTPEELAQHTRIGKFRPLRQDQSYGGPYDPWIRSPELAKRAVSFGTFIWNRTTLERRLVELAILVTGRFWEANVEWVSHSRMAVEYGVAQEVIDTIFEKRRPEKAPEDELVVYDVCRALHETHRLPKETFQKAVGLFGERGLVEIIATIGYYTMVAMTLNAFEVGLEEGIKAPFPL